MLGLGGLTGQIEPPAELVVPQSRREGQLVFPVLRLGVERRGVGVKSAGGRVGNRIARREVAQHAVEGAYLLAGVFTADVEVSRGPRADAEVEPAAQVLVLIPGDISLDETTHVIGGHSPRSLSLGAGGENPMIWRFPATVSCRRAMSSPTMSSLSKVNAPTL
jgi:hypothetical protein